MEFFNTKPLKMPFLFVIAGMGKGFGDGEGMKSRNGDWK
jgi:hypothetical protein